MTDLDLSGDFAVFDNQQEMTITGGSEPQTTNAIKRWVTTREAEASNGKYTTDDCVFHISGTDLSDSPEVGWTAAVANNNWTILGVRHERLTDRWELIARELKLLDAVTIEQATFTSTEDGVQEANWTEEHVDLAAAFQLISATDTEEHKNQGLKPRFRVYLSQTIETKNRRVVYGGEVYRITGHSDADRIDTLFTIEVEEW